MKSNAVCGFGALDINAAEPTVVTTGSKGRHSTGAPFSFASVTLASKIVGDIGTSPELTNPINAAGAMSWTLTSCSLIFSRYSRPHRIQYVADPTHSGGCASDRHLSLPFGIQQVFEIS